MKTILLRNSGVVFLVIVMLGLALGFGLSVGEKHEVKNKWDLITNKDGLVYRINKQTGEVSLIAGTGAIKVEGTENLDGQKDTSPSAVDWPSKRMNSATNSPEDIEELYNLPRPTYGETNPPPAKKLLLKLKTKWRAGTLYYDFKIARNENWDQIKQNNPNAKITIQLLDGDGFAIVSIPVMLSDMARLTDSGFEAGCEAEGSVVCGVDTFKDIKSWNYTWIGFTPP